MMPIFFTDLCKINHQGKDSNLCLLIWKKKLLAGKDVRGLLVTYQTTSILQRIVGENYFMTTTPFPELTNLSVSRIKFTPPLKFSPQRSVDYFGGALQSREDAELSERSGVIK